MNTEKKIFIIIPAYNEEKAIDKLLKELKSICTYELIVVNDGSNDKTTKTALQNGATVLEHSINRGAGAATRTGIEYAIQQKADFIVTMDGDGQHSPSDLANIIEKLLNTDNDVVIGSRLINREQMPIHRRFFNVIGNIITYIFFGIYVSDTQSGFKGFNRNALKKIDFQSDGYEFCSEVIREIKVNKLKHIEVPIKTIYTKYSLSKGQNFSKGVAILFKLFFGK